MNTLLRKLDPHVQQRVSLYKGRVAIPHQAIEGHARYLALHALESFDPKAGAQVATHVVNHLQRVSRFVNQNKNIARIPEHRLLKIGTFEAVKSQLETALGRPPSMEELADELGWSHREVQVLARSLSARSLSASAMPESLEGEFGDRRQETMSFVRFGLTPLERDAFDHLYGFNGKTKLSVAETAKKTEFSPDYLYRMLRRTALDIQRNG